MPFAQATQSPAAPPAAAPAPAAPQAPAAPAAAPVGVRVGEATIPIDASRLTAADVEGLRARRSELSTQINSAMRRRDELLRKMDRADEAAREGMQPQLAVLNARIAELEQAIALNGQMLAAAPLTGSSREPEVRYGPFSSGQLTAISIVGTVTVLMPLALALSRLLLARARNPKPAPVVLESAARLERMEQAIDAVAEEVERISEGQRYVTQLMASRERVEIGRGETS
ncbi:MAG: hypothetical protein IBJ19_11880 [Gemmatimonadaceae bacterium]|jgi:hypothetical protein|nr:hypothetical protein [Gemmatimonadaceae bacterium]